MTNIFSIGTARTTVATADSEPNRVAEQELMTKHAESIRSEGAQQFDHAAHYEVGYGRPPKRTQFKPGRSGNPKGRKRKPPLLPDLKRIFVEALSEKATVKQGDKERTLTMVEAGFKQLARQHAQGDRHARRELFDYAEKLGIDLLASHRESIEKALSTDHQAILDAYVARRTQATVLHHTSPIFAPPELLDDDTDDTK